MERNTVLDTLSQFRRTKGAEYHIRRLGVFGSAARNQLADTSDVDVVVELGEPDLFLLVGIKQELEELLMRPVDIVRYRKRMNSFLKQQIDKEAIYV